MNKISEGLINFINEELELGNDMEIKEDTEFVEIGVDSIAIMTILVYLEETYDIEVSEEVLIEDKFKCIGDVAKYISSRLEEK